MRLAAACCALLGGASGHILHHKYEGLDTPRSREQFHFGHHETVEVAHPYYGVVNKSTYKSPAVKLMNGEAWFTLPTVNRMPFPEPGVPYSIVAFGPDVYDEFGRRPPLTELYDHHWLMYDNVVGGSGDNLGCGGRDSFVSNIVGAGAEMRAIDYHYPNGYGYFSTEGQGYWSANLHFINTLDLSDEHFQDQPDPHGAAVKACVECNWSPGNTGIACTKNSKGNFGCCIDGGRCLTKNMQNKTKTTYYLQYDVFWTTDLTMVKPLAYAVIDTFSCASLGNVAPNMHTKTHDCDDKVCVGTIERTIDKSGEIVGAYTHQHVGAINASFYLNGAYVCTSAPGYGTDPTNPILNEKGYINAWDVCIDADLRNNAKVKSLKVKKGDSLKVVSLYNVAEEDPRILPMPGGQHGGVMGLFYFYLVPDDAYKCVDGKCVATAWDGVDLPTCQAAC